MRIEAPAFRAGLGQRTGRRCPPAPSATSDRTSCRSRRPRSVTFTAIWPTLCAPSTSTGIPLAWAASTISAMGMRRPQVNWMWLSPTSRVRSVIADLTRIQRLTGGGQGLDGGGGHADAIALGHHLCRGGEGGVLQVANEQLVVRLPVHAVDDHVDALAGAVREDYVLLGGAQQAGGGRRGLSGCITGKGHSAGACGGRASPPAPASPPCGAAPTWAWGLPNLYSCI